ncbi:MAG: hypothetical protein BWY93_00131 [Euryarchaeota archaeon ADurb.BinA087]|nr:MAG: hypothetical protein BWY93_00131 [Euryarchaeota archaeon ADurb.BinA087]
MGYWSTLHLIGVKIKQKSVPVVDQELNTHSADESSELGYFLDHAVIDCDGFLSFKASADGHDPYVPFDDGTVPAMYGKWYEAESIAEWVKQYSEEGGRIILHSLEADGEAWGWVFDGKGKMRELQLKEIGKWK